MYIVMLSSVMKTKEIKMAYKYFCDVVVLYLQVN